MSTGNARLAAFALTEKTTPEGAKTFWTKIGVAFRNKDDSITIKLDALPLSGTMQIREDTQRDSKPPRDDLPNF